MRGFRPREHIVSPQLRRMDWCSRMLVASVRQAFDDAGALPLEEQIRPRTALVVGSCFGNQRETAVYLQRVLKQRPGRRPADAVPESGLERHRRLCGNRARRAGTELCVAEHEASGEAALATALDLLASGACDLVCAAGVDELSAIQLDGSVRSSPAPPRRHARRSGAPPRSAPDVACAARSLPGEGAAALRAGARPARRRARRHAAMRRSPRRAIGAIAAPAYGFAGDADAAAARLLELADVPGPVVSGVIGGASGLAARDALDAAVLRALEQRGAERPGYAPFKRLVGDFGAAGALGAVLASLALDAGLLPGSPPVREPQRLLVVGAARGGVLVPLVLDRCPGPRRCSSTASTSSSSC